MLIVVSGLPGTGKTTVATAVAESVGAVHLSVDSIEDALLGAGLAPGWTTGVAAYEAARAVSAQNLQLGRTVVVDAVNDSRAARDTWVRVTADYPVRVVFFLLRCHDAAEHRRRLESRERRFRHLAEPTWHDVRARDVAYEPWPDVDLTLDATAPVQELVDRIRTALPY